MTDKSSDGDRKKGFAGFGDLVSDVSKDIESATRESSNPPTPKYEAAVSSTSSTQHTTAQKEVPRANKPPMSPRTPGGSSNAKWVLGIAIAMVIFINIVNSVKEKSTSHTPSTTYSPQSTDTPASIPETSPPPASVYSPALPKEDKPPVGTNLSLSRDQIRYCLSEDIRLGVMKNTINQHANNEVDLFNTKVHDYNSRCGKFRYRRGSLESVQSEVETNRLMLEADGLARLVDLRGESAQVKDTQAEQNLQKSDSQPKRHEEARSPESPSDKRIVNSSHTANFARCSDGRYSNLCDHSLLVGTENAKVSAAAPSDSGIKISQDRENYTTCISGEYPSICKHSLLTSAEATQVAAAELRAKRK